MRLPVQVYDVGFYDVRDMDGHVVAECDEQDDAGQIAAALNSHDKLVEALRTLLGEVTRARAMALCQGSEWVAATRQAEAALAAAYVDTWPNGLPSVARDFKRKQ